MGEVVEREMSLSHREFWRILTSAFAGEIVSMEEESAELECTGVRVGIALSPESMRRIGSLRLPVTNARLELRGGNAAAWRQFQDRFQRSFQRGGG